MWLIPLLDEKKRRYGEDMAPTGQASAGNAGDPLLGPHPTGICLCHLLRHFLHSSDSLAGRDLGLVTPTGKKELAFQNTLNKKVTEGIFQVH